MLDQIIMNSTEYSKRAENLRPLTLESLNLGVAAVVGSGASICWPGRPSGQATASQPESRECEGGHGTGVDSRATPVPSRRDR